MTDAELALWSRLRARGLAGWKFRRQAPVGPYVTDFLCSEARLIVEIDGGHHGGAADAAREARLSAMGYAVVRYWNNEVLQNMGGVLLDMQARFAARALTPALSREREWGRGVATCAPRHIGAPVASISPLFAVAGEDGAIREVGRAVATRAPRRIAARAAQMSPPLPHAGEDRGEGGP
jgi:very-short-patch-repair endonuclease